jgi:7-cyano-7-deazaguanine synthase in queuosine biosynthesis
MESKYPEKVKFVTSLGEVIKSREFFADSERNIVVLWSGGLDSTFLLYKLADELKHKPNPVTINVVSARAFSSEKNETPQSKAETIQRKKIIPLLKKEFKGKVNFNFQTDILMNYTETLKVGFYLGQPYLWLTHILLRYNRNANIKFAYIMEDSFPLILPEIMEVVYGSIGALGIENLVIDYPLIRYKKQTIIQAIPENYLTLVSYCEQPIYDSEKEFKYKNCGGCHSCELHEEALKYNEYFSSTMEVTNET